MKTEVDIGEVRIKNPVMTASGTFGYGEEYAGLVDLGKLGAVVTKGITLEACKGNPPPRAVETVSGMLNAIGLQNVGVETFIEEKLPFLRERNVPCVVNIQGSTKSEFVEVARRLNNADGVIALELNVSCPNVEKGLDFGTDVRELEGLVSAVKKATKLPLMTKLSPNVTSIVEMAKAAVDGGTDSVSLINTLIGMAIDVQSRRPILTNVTGGLSGPAIKPVALRMVWEVAKAVDVPVIGIGGISTTEDALEFLIAGATAIQVGTASFYNPRASEEIADGILRYMKENDIDDINDIVGCLEIKGRTRKDKK